VKAWMTKYALTAGIQEIECELCVSVPGMISRRSNICTTEYFHGEGREWHTSRQSAEDRAEIMRLNRISSLEKQIRKLKALNFKEGGAK
jgi:hypothetical protein